MILSILIRSFKSSLIGRKLIRLRPSIIKGSFTYRALILIYKTLSDSYDRSFIVRLLRKLCYPIESKVTLQKFQFKEGSLLKRALDIFLSPFILPIGFLFFFMVSLVRVCEGTVLLLLLTVISMLLGIALARAEEEMEVIDPRGFVLFLGASMFLIGYAAFIVQIANAGGIPLLDEQVRRKLSAELNYLSWTTVPGAAFILSSSKVRRCEAIIFSIIGFIPSFLLAFRTEMIAYILAILTVLYNRKLIGLGFITTAFMMLIISFIGVGAFRSIATGLVQNPIISVLYRPTITVAALDTIVRLYGFRPVTNGYIHLAAISSLGLISGSRYGPRNLIGRYTLGRTDVSTTATLIGGPLLDWGILGVLASSLIYSYMLALSHRFSRGREALLGPYAVLYSYLVVGIETGVLDLNVYIYLLISILIVIFSLRPKR
ncbi:oligosaccharide repeat unit polymerase family protein [Candidatus Korarchaeum cryptofilum]|uniref:Oligosaccharide repeat unit polymerase n=1 Tax=Korarchaeum cryptofilum (strain OPF8) TaxID=374847 RepID=B1L722_KORCO|nr:oligosaccharide repeat unit polymerase family protein [Candidatus Korarchaeum cryptofilum]ACB08251.1 hypothetical protein Kcr_1505 [Candidatus Korarchaeum cryptofilum OPF8]